MPLAWPALIALLLFASCNVQNPVLEKKDVTPVFSPEGGKYSTSQSVSITIRDSKNIIAYSTDGSDPRSGVYPLQSVFGSASVRVEKSQTLLAAVRFEDGSYGPLVQADYSILDTPIVSFPQGSYIGAQIVSLSCATPGASIHYTLDGGVPTRSSTRYTVPLNVDSSLTLRAVSWKDGWGTSPVVTVRYALQARAPVASVPAGVYRSSQSITLSASSGATIRCTRDGSIPSTASSVCSGAIQIDSDMVVRAIATLPGQSPSFETYLDYAILHPPEIQPSAGFYESPQSLRITTNSKGDATIRYTLDGSLPTASSPSFASSVKIQSPSKVQAIVLRNGVASQVAVADLEVVVPPSFDPPAGRYAGSVQVAMSTPTVKASIRYTSDSTNPDRSSKTFSSPVTITSNTAFRAATEIGDTLGRTVQAIYVIAPESTVARPAIGPAGGSYIGRQQVYMSCATPGAQIRYTLDGRFPTRNDSLYTAPLTISYNTTVKAVAILDSVSSPLATATYSISQLQSPGFSPSPGTYRGNQAVFIKSGTPGATVRCTKDGSYPTASSPVCDNAITVYAGTTTINALATYGDQVSSVSSATYEITSTSGGGSGGGTGSCSYCSYTISTMESRIESDRRRIDQLVSTNARAATIQAARDQLAADQRLRSTLIQCGCR